MVGDHREIPFWLLKKKCLHFTYFITIFRVKAVCQAVRQYAIQFHPINQLINQSINQSINQPINYSYIFVAF